uniref:Uncharacterized protein LOC114337149 n=1 Tax=Diabrotica virgifera virgifera TaxID=50390 RepID=A0A6P7G303_DIAVI
MARENITGKAERLHDNPSYAKISPNNRFSVFNNSTNFPSLPLPSTSQTPNSSFLLRKPIVRNTSPKRQVKKRKPSAPESPPISQYLPTSFHFQSKKPNLHIIPSYQILTEMTLSNIRKN